MQAVNIRLAQYAVRLSRKELRLLVGLLTGHNTLNRHLALLRRMDDPLCTLCRDEEDTSLHFQAAVVPSPTNDVNSLESIFYTQWT